MLKEIIYLKKKKIRTKKDAIDKNKVLNVNAKCTKSPEDKTKNNKKPLFKVIGRKTRRYKKNIIF